MIPFPERTCAFLTDLARNNDRAWFAANRARYESDWLHPAIDYVTELSEHMARLVPPHRAEARVNGSIRRLQRDIRFSKDKTPYDAKLHLVFWTGDHPNRSPAIHIVLHADRLGLGAGQFAMTSGALARYRHAVANDSHARQRLDDILDRLRIHGCGLTKETLKRLPTGFTVAQEHETLLKRKGLVVRTGESALAPGTICNTAEIMAFSTLAAELNNWLNENVVKA